MTIALGVLVALLGLLGLVVAAVRSWRATLRGELRAYLAEQRPDLTVIRETADLLVLQDAEGKDAATLYLHRLYREASGDPSARRELFDKLVGALAEAEASQRLDPAELRRRVMPRIVNAAFLEGLRDLPREIPAVALGVEGLFVVFVLDSPNSVAYLASDRLGDLGLDAPAALALAKQNLARSFDAALPRQAVSRRDVYVVKTLDTYDAARLLLVPDHLEPGETLVAMIPDRDTLVLAQLPDDGDWSSLHRIAKSASAEALHPRPLLVTPGGIAAAPS